MEIIVASNNLFRRELSSFILSEAGYTVHEVSDSKTLLHCLNRIQPALIVLDARLGEANNGEVARYIRQQEDSILIMVLRSTSTSFDKTTTLTMYGDDQLDWPYQAEDLLLHVQSLLGRGTQPAHVCSA